MLRELRIRNFAVVENVTVGFTPGLNVLTGETGAGKSIHRRPPSDCGCARPTDLIRTEAEAATVEAVFDLPKNGGAAGVLGDAGLAADDGEVVIRRELTRAGRHRAFVNDSPVTVALLERLGDHLVDVHGQHEHQRLLEPLRQLELVDRFADVDELAERVAGLFAKFCAARAEVERTRGAERDRAQRETCCGFKSRSSMPRGSASAKKTSSARSVDDCSTPSGFAAGIAEVTAAPRLGPQSWDTAWRAPCASSASRPARPRLPTAGEGLEAARIHVEDASSRYAVSATAVSRPARLERSTTASKHWAAQAKYGDSEAAMVRHRARPAPSSSRPPS